MEQEHRFKYDMWLKPKVNGTTLNVKATLKEHSLEALSAFVAAAQQQVMQQTKIKERFHQCI